VGCSLAIALVGGRLNTQSIQPATNNKNFRKAFLVHPYYGVLSNWRSENEYFDLRIVGTENYG
tara:strand:- start:331 stop:519 length:189 start_codon:yes stop_codon:yes gene_type:complete